MRTLEELTLYANGLLEEHEEAAVKAHVESCQACQAELQALSTERGLLLRAAAVEARAEAPAGLLSPRPRRARAGILVSGFAAAALLGVLPWLLSRPATSVLPADIAPLAQSSGEEIDRLIGELRSSSALRREIAAVALKAYGTAAVEKLVKANADPVLLDACRGITPEDRAVLKKLGELLVTFDMQNAPLTAAVDYLREISQLSFHISGVDDPDLRAVSLKVASVRLSAALHLILEPLALSYAVRDGIVVVSTPAQLKGQSDLHATPRAPIRLPLQEAVVRRHIAALGSDTPGEREKATAALLGIGFASEPLLWEALDSVSPEVRSRASDVLRQLYNPRPAGPVDEASRRLDELKPNLDFENTEASQILTFLGHSVGLPILVITESAELNRKVTFKTKDLAAKNSLKLFFSQFVLDYVVVDGTILMVAPGSGILRTPPHPIWKSPEEASRTQAALRQVAAGDEVDVLRTFRTEDLGALLQAGKALEGPAGRRCRRAASLVAENAHLWAIDQGSGVDLQELTDVQRGILGVEGVALENEPLIALLARHGLKYSLKTPVELRVRAYGATARMSSLLKGLLRPQGFDFFMEGQTIVIDTVAGVRAAVEK